MPNIETNVPAQNTPALERVHAILAIFLVVFIIAKLAMLLISPRSAAVGSDLTIGNIMQAVNRERELRNLLTLSTNVPLGMAAQGKADDMQSRHYFAHVDPDGNYIWPKITAAGYTPYLQLGENLAIEFYDTESLVAAWMNSPTHRANILNDGFKDQGMGLNFGNSSSGQYHSAIVNTFGALVPKKVQAAPAEPEPQTVSGANTPAPAAPKPAATKPKPQAKPAPTPAPVPAPAQNPEQAPAPTAVSPSPAPEPAAPVTHSETPLSPRGDFTLALNGRQDSQDTPATASPLKTERSAPAIVNPIPTSASEQNQNNRYFTLAFGFVLFLFLVTDLRGMMESKSAALSKKLNNLVLLFIALAVIAAFYWL